MCMWRGVSVMYMYDVCVICMHGMCVWCLCNECMCVCVQIYLYSCVLRDQSKSSALPAPIYPLTPEYHNEPGVCSCSASQSHWSSSLCHHSHAHTLPWSLRWAHPHSIFAHRYWGSPSWVHKRPHLWAILHHNGPFRTSCPSTITPES